MMTDGHATNRALARLLLERLKPLASRLETFDPMQGIQSRGPQLFGYCCVARERIARVTSARPRIGIVLSGEKEFWLGDSGQHFVAGDVFLPADARRVACSRQNHFDRSLAVQGRRHQRPGHG